MDIMHQFAMVVHLDDGAEFRTSFEMVDVVGPLGEFRIVFEDCGEEFEGGCVGRDVFNDFGIVEQEDGFDNDC